MSAVLPIEVKSLNHAVLEKYEKHPEFIQILDEWVLVPDYDLLKHFDAIADTFNKIKPLPKTGLIYRGFSTSNFLQNSKFVDIKNLNVDDRVDIKLENPLSFTEDMSIATAFGKNVISCRNHQISKDCIYFSDELCYLISKNRGIEDSPETQKEILVLPRAKQFEVTIVRKAPAWALW